MRAVGIEGIATTVRTDPDDRPPDDLGTAMIPAEIDLIGHRDRDDPETGMDSARTDLIDHRDPGDPGTQRSIEMIDMRGSGDQVDRPPPLHPQVLRLG